MTVTLTAENSEGVATRTVWVRGLGGWAEAWVLSPVPRPPQFFVLLLLVFLLEVTVTVLFFAYTDKVSPSAGHRLWGLHREGPQASVPSSDAPLTGGS